jgi:branched-chain amino acid transport system ATP-binding protein
MLLEVKDIRVHYDGAEALKDVSLWIEEGMIVTLIGANGAGKSTTLKTISGLKHPASGEIWFQSERIDRLQPQAIVKRGIAQVPEGRRLFPGMTVLENLRVGAYLRKDGEGIKTDFQEIFEHFPILSERRRQAAGTLSGGEQQMLAIGRALMSRPKLLLLDEPSLGLAPKMVSEIAKIITDINQRGTSILLVEQNAHMALTLAQRGYVMQTGSIMLEGTTKELMSSDDVKRSYLGG